MTLFEIDKRLEELIQIDPETGEILSDAEELEKLEMDRETKIESIACMIKNYKASSAAIKDEAKKMQARAKSDDSKAEWLTNYLASSLQGEKFSTPKCSISYRKTQSVSCRLEEKEFSMIPNKYLRFSAPSLDKLAIKDALKNGEKVYGCELVENVSMIIK